jgi:GH15 family glucan-1,4-alpha-glucosidase
MDDHYPILFDNAVSYRGLRSAAALAKHVGARAEALAYDEAADRIQSAWRAEFERNSGNNPRTFSSGLWPTWITGNDIARSRNRLQERRNAQYGPDGCLRRYPVWTYFTVAEAHQWLYLGEPERAWETIRWFWNHQTSPGLYTWWEGWGEENTSGRWEHVRGWLAPVTSPRTTVEDHE